MNLINLIIRYSLFAVVATIVNLSAQRCVLQFGTTAIYYALAVASGTALGLVVKYFMDKRWIFYNRQIGLKNHRRMFSLYAIMGLVTTAVFWGTETLFWQLFRSNSMRELGAVIGLTIGYVVKYQLDRRFVFSNHQMVINP